MAKKLVFRFFVSAWVLIFLLANIIFVKQLFVRGEVFSFWAAYVLFFLISLLFIFQPEWKKKGFSVLMFLFFLEFLLVYLGKWDSYSERKGVYFYKMPYYKLNIPKNRKPNERISYTDSEYSFEYSANSFGLRDEEVSGDSIKIVWVGDSFAEGIGASFSHRPDQLLEKKLGCEHCVLNLGLGGSDLINSYQILMDSILSKNKISPKLVVLNLNNSDVNDIKYRAKEYGVDLGKQPGFLYQAIFGGCRLVRAFSSLLGRGQWDLLSKEQSKYAEKKVIEVIYNKVLLYNQSLQEKKIGFLLVLQPFHNTIKYKTEDGYEYIKQKLPQSGVRYVDLYPYFEAEIDLIDTYYWPIDMHFNDKGYDKFMEGVYVESEKKYPGIFKMN